MTIVEAHGEVLKDVEDMIARASKAFGALCRPVFQDNSLSMETKRIVYHAVFMGGFGEQEDCYKEAGIL